MRTLQSYQQAIRVHSGDWREEFRPDIPSPARVYDYLLGGKDHYPADRVVAENLLKEMPEARGAARENRAFLGRTVSYLTAEAGVSQFLDIGTGLPTRGQVHDIARGIAPQSRVVYVDNDPVVLVHGRDMLHGIDNTEIIRQDLRNPRGIIDAPETRRLLDFDRPMALLLVAVLHFIGAAEDPWALVRTLMEPMPPGSYLVISHATADGRAKLDHVLDEHYKTTSSVTARPYADIAAFFDGLELIEPGIVRAPQWRPGPGTGLQEDPAASLTYVGVARKPGGNALGSQPHAEIRE